MKGWALKVFFALCRLMGILPCKISTRRWHRSNTLWAVASVFALTASFAGYLLCVTLHDPRKFNTVDVVINSITYLSDVAAQVCLFRTKSTMSVMLKFKQVNVLTREIRTTGRGLTSSSRMTLFLACEVAVYLSCILCYCAVAFPDVSHPLDLLEIFFYVYAYSVNGFMVLLLFNFLLFLHRKVSLMTECVDGLWDYERHFRSRYPRHFKRENVVDVKLSGRGDDAEMLCHLKHLHFVLYDLLNAVSSFFQVPFLLTLILYLLHVVVSVYYIARVVTLKGIILNVLPIVYESFLLGLSCFACHLVARQVSASSDRVSGHLLVVEDPRLVNDLLLFQRQLRTCAMTVNVCGVTTLDSKFLATMGASLTTYLGILFTFRPATI